MKKNKLLKVLSAAALASSLAAVDLNVTNNTNSNFAYAADETSKAVEVPALLHHFYENRNSMGNAALSKVTVEKVNGGYKYSVHWHDMEFSGKTDGISKFWVEGNEVALVDDPTGTGPNPKVATFTLPQLKNRIDVEVFVNAMESISAGSGRQKAYLQLDTSAAKAEFDKPAQSTKRIVVRTETIPFETERVENKNMPKGIETTTQEGKNGSVDIVRDDIYEGDKLVKQGEEKQVNRVEPVKKIVMYGTKEGSTTPTTEAPKDHLAENVTVDGTSTATGSFQQANDKSKPSAYNAALVPEVKVEKVDNNYKYTFQVQPANTRGMSFELEAISYNGKELTMKEIDAVKKLKEVTLTTSELFDKLQLAGTVTYPNRGPVSHPMTLVLKDFKKVEDNTKPAVPEKNNNNNLVIEKDSSFKVGEYITLPSGLKVKVNIVELIEHPGFNELRVGYTETNDTNNKLSETQFALFLNDGSVEHQTGFFNDLYPSESKNRVFTVKLLKNQVPALLEVGSDFFSKQPAGLPYLSLVENNNLINPTTPTTPVKQTTKQVVVRTETIPFKTEQRENANLPKGETKVVQEGKNGSVDIVRDDIYEGDKLVKQGEEKQVNRVEAVNKIVEIGTKVENPAPTPNPTNPTTPTNTSTITKYSGVKPTLMHAHEAGRKSMGNAALVKTDVYKEGNTYHYSVYFKDINFSGQTDGITKFWVRGSEVPVVKTGGANNEVVVNFTSTEKLTTLPVSVFVQTMENIMPGGGKQNATLTFDWSNAKEETTTTRPTVPSGPKVNPRTPTPTPGNPATPTNQNPTTPTVVPGPTADDIIADAQSSNSTMVDATVYNGVRASLMHAHEAGRASMGNAALDYVQVYKVGDTYHYVVFFKDLKVGSLSDGISRFWVNGVEYPVVATGGANNQVKVHFTSTEKLDQIPVSVYVQTMENIMPGGGKQDAILAFDWSNVTEEQTQVANEDVQTGTAANSSSALSPKGGRYNNGRLANTGLETSSSILAGMLTLLAAFFLGRRKEK